MHSKKQVSSRHYAVGTIIHFLLLTAYCLLLTAYSSAEIINRVVAYVDDTAITLSEFEETYNEMREAVKDITKEETINSMINSVLLLHEARKMRLDAPTKEDLVKDYIDIKIRSLIFIRESDIRAFYEKNIDKFKGIDYLQVRDEIESYLFELETNRRLQSHLEQLRANAEIKIQLE
jgi:hypothetical protein